MKRLLYIFCLVLLTLIPCASVAKLSFRHINNSNGLSAVHIKCILRDSRDFMWFGTKNGLNVFDGQEVLVLKCFDPEKKRGNNNIDALHEDRMGNIWVGTDRGVFVYTPSTGKFNAMTVTTNRGEWAENWVQNIEEDTMGNIWVLCPDQGLFRYTGDEVELYNPGRVRRIKEEFFSDICADSDGNVYALTNGGDIFKYNITTDSFDRMETAGKAVEKNPGYCRIVTDSRSDLYIANNRGDLYSVDVDQNYKIKRIPFSQTGSNYVRDIIVIDDDLCIGTQHGIYAVNLKDHTEQVFLEDPLDSFSLSDNTITCIYSDKDKNAWIGTMFGGINYWPNNPFSFKFYGLSSGLSSRHVIGLQKTVDGKLWVGTENAGINLFNPSTGLFSQPVKSPEGCDGIILNLEPDGRDIVAAFSSCGLLRISADGHTGPLTDDPEISHSSCYSYLKDSNGNEWVGLGYSLMLREAGKADFHRVDATGYDWIFTINEAGDGTIWFGTMGNGLWKYTPANGKFKSYTYNDGEINPHSLRSNSISSITEDHKGNIWISTDRGGLSRYNKATDDFTTYSEPEGLPDGDIYKVLEDGSGYLWFGTNKGLVKFNPDTETVKIFTTKDGLPSNQFSYHSAQAMPDGMFYFGTINGIVAFNPELDSNITSPAPLYFTSLNILGNTNKQYASESSLFPERVRLPYDCSSFSVKVSSPIYHVSGIRTFSYRLLPDNKEWRAMEGNTISFNNLSPGNYTLEVRTGEGSSLSSCAMQISILPPWWRSGWAYAFYSLIAILAGVSLFLWYTRRNERRIHEREKNFAAIKERELYRSKVNFFTEIAHEIRTPLSLIDIPLEAIEENGLDHPDSKRFLKVTRQNTRRLLELTSQLLDFQKIDSNKLILKNEPVNVIALLRETIGRFEPSITLSGKTLNVELSETPLVVSTDREALLKIISNLLNNALKYSASAISVRLNTESDSFAISVTSNGPKIKPQDREHIFDAFYQSDRAHKENNGVGIGLPLSRSLATLLGGELVLEDNTDELNIFTLRLPVIKPNEDVVETIDLDKENYLMDDESNQTKLRQDGYNLLIVEDNDGIRSMLKEQLSKSFFVDTAANGREALEKLGANPFDLIITDLMMPVMDGFELCKAVKNDEELSTIPILIVTAKNDLDSKIKGLQLGAEAFIEKPFSLKYLKQSVHSILENRKREREAFSKKPFFNVDSIHTSKADEEFMNKCIDVINAHVSEEDFNVESLTDIMCMSRSSLLRKIKALFNLSPSELIRLVKLKKAAELIQDGNYRIGEICVMVGISSPSYFAKLFAKQFNVTPKEFAKQCQATRNSTETNLQD